MRLDLALREEDRLVLGILVDGPHYAAFPEARDRERILPSVLEGLGWRLARVWSPEWSRDPEGVLARIEEALGLDPSGESE